MSLISAYLAVIGQRNSLDPDAAAFISASGATDTAAINNFVKALKAASLWTNLVCWPARSTQNAGSGTTLHAIGGLSAGLNATLNGTVSWTPEGLGIAASAGYVTFPTMSDFSSGIFAGSVHKVVSVAADNRGLSMETTGGQIGGFWAPYSDGKMYWDALDFTTSRVEAASGATSGSYNMWSGSSNGPRACINKTSLGVAGITGSLGSAFNKIQFGRNGFDNNFNGAVSFVFIMRESATLAQIEAFYDIYKANLGTGLGLS